MSSTSPGPETLTPLTPERRRRQTREHLLEAAAAVFAERGYHGASMDQVAAAAGFTKGAVYSNFKHKEDLFLELLEHRGRRQLETVRAALEAEHSRSPEEALAYWEPLTKEMVWGDREWQLLYLEFCLYAARNEEARRKLVERERTIHDLLVPIIEETLADMVAEPRVSASEFTTLVLALFNGIALRHIVDPDADRIVETTLDVLNRAVVYPD